MRRIDASRARSAPTTSGLAAISGSRTRDSTATSGSGRRGSRAGSTSRTATFADHADFRSLPRRGGVRPPRLRVRGRRPVPRGGGRQEVPADRLAVRGAARPLQGQAPRLRLPRRDRAGRGPAVRLPNARGRAALDPHGAARAGGSPASRAGDHARAMEEYGLLKRIFEGLHRYDRRGLGLLPLQGQPAPEPPARSWRRPWTKLAQFADWLLLDIGCGYGTNPLRAVRAAVAIMLAFGLIYIAAPSRCRRSRPAVPGTSARRTTSPTAAWSAC